MTIGAELHTLTTHDGAGPNGWPEDVWSLIVWAAIGCGDWPDASPEADIAQQRAQGGDPAVALASLAVTLATAPAGVVLAAAFAGRTRVDTARRDAAIRAWLESGSPGERRPLRQVAQATGLTHPAVMKIRDRGNRTHGAHHR